MTDIRVILDCGEGSDDGAGHKMNGATELAVVLGVAHIPCSIDVNSSSEGNTGRCSGRELHEGICAGGGACKQDDSASVLQIVRLQGKKPESKKLSSRSRNFEAVSVRD
jgi:hypothetical protein